MTSPHSLKAIFLAVTGVEDCHVVKHCDPAHSVEIFIRGGSDEDIARAFYEQVPCTVASRTRGSHWVEYLPPEDSPSRRGARVYQDLSVYARVYSFTRLHVALKPCPASACDKGRVFVYGSLLGRCTTCYGRSYLLPDNGFYSVRLLGFGCDNQAYSARVEGGCVEFTGLDGDISVDVKVLWLRKITELDGTPVDLLRPTVEVEAPDPFPEPMAFPIPEHVTAQQYVEGLRAQGVDARVLEDGSIGGAFVMEEEA